MMMMMMILATVLLDLRWILSCKIWREPKNFDFVSPVISLQHRRVDSSRFSTGSVYVAYKMKSTANTVTAVA
jgi:chorismate mutase